MCIILGALMLSMKERALVGVIVVFVAVVAASVIIPVRTFEVRLVTSPPDSAVYVPAGKRFSITCYGTGDEDKYFTSLGWLNKGGLVIREGAPSVQKDGTNSAKLIFTDPKVEESGVYKCTAVYDKVHNLEKEIKITFYGLKPTFQFYYENITVEEGLELKINCSAVGDGHIIYEWYQFEDKVSEDNSSSIFVLNSDSKSTLVIREVSQSHEGIYTCLAKNDHGLSSKVYQLTVFPSPGNETDDDASILKIDVRNITSNSVKFFIAVSGLVKSIQVKYEESRERIEYHMEWDYGDNYEVKGLLPSGRYTFQFSAVPSSDKSWSTHFVTLLPDKPELIFQNVGEGSVKLQWFVKTDDIMRGTIDGYELRYFSVSMLGGNKWIPGTCAVVIQIPTCTGSSYTIAGLRRNTYYEIQLRAHTVSGYGEPYKQKIYLPS